MATSEKIAEVIINAGIVQGIFYALIVLGRKKSHTYLVFALLTLNMSLIIYHSYYVSAFFMHLIKSPFIVDEPFVLLISPLFYFYVRNLVTNIKIRFTDFLHFLPTLLFFISFIPVYLYGKNTLYFNFLYNNSLILTVFLWLIAVVQFSYYFIKIGRLTHEHITKAEKEYADIQDFNINWIRWILWIYIIFMAFIILVFGVILHTGKFEHFKIYNSLLFTLGIFFICYKESKLKLVNTVVDSSNVLIIEQESEKNKKLKSELIDFMEINKPYLNPELTLTELSSLTGIGRNQLSYILNTGLNENFYNFINRYRIDYFKKLLQDPEKKNYTILALAFEAGFNSKSSFNTVFKNITGLTPSGYRNGLM